MWAGVRARVYVAFSTPSLSVLQKAKKDKKHKKLTIAGGSGHSPRVSPRIHKGKKKKKKTHRDRSEIHEV